MSVNGYLRKTIESDADLAKRVLIVEYEDLCQLPEEELRRIFGHIELEVEGAFIGPLAETLQAPDYYKPGFSEEEVLMIRDLTHRV